MDIQKEAQALGDSFHDGLEDLDTVMHSQAKQLVTAIAIRKRAGMRGQVGQRTIARMLEALLNTEQAREKLSSAHQSAQRDSVTMDWPINCPEEIAQLEGAEQERSIAHTP